MSLSQIVRDGKHYETTNSQCLTNTSMVLVTARVAGREVSLYKLPWPRVTHDPNAYAMSRKLVPLQTRRTRQHDFNTYPPCEYDPNDQSRRMSPEIEDFDATHDWTVLVFE